MHLRLRAILSILLCTSLLFAMLQSISATTAAAYSKCPTETAYTGYKRSPEEYVAQADVSTRGIMGANCFLAQDPLEAGAVYRYGDCRSTVVVHAEAIAQARALARMSVLAGGASNPIHPRVQWELKPDGQSTRIDIGVVDASSPVPRIGLIEAKVSWDGANESSSAAERQEAEASTQLARYIRLWNAAQPNSTAYELTVPPELVGDRFIFDLDPGCVSGNGLRAYEYTTRAAANTQRVGVLMIDRKPITCAQAADGLEQATPEPSTPEPVYDGWLGKDEDGNGRDDFLDAFDGGAFGDVDIPRELPHILLRSVPVRVFVTRTAAVALLQSWQALLAVHGASGASLETVAAQTLLALALRVVVAAIPGAGQVLLVTTVAVFAATAAEMIAAALKNRSWNVWGDPHMVSLDRLTYDLQAAGEFHAVTVPEHGIDVQARLTPLNGSVSAMSAVAFELDGVPVEIRSDGKAFVDGEQVDLSAPAEHGLNDFFDGFGLAYSSGQFVAVFPTGEVLSTDGRNVSFQPGAGVRTQGLLGDHDGVPTNDLATRDGEQVSPAATSTIHGRYADSWRITNDESLFTYADGQSTETFTDRAFPASVVTVTDFPPNEIEAASDTCRSQDVPDGPQFDDCVLDVLVTGDDDYATAAAATKEDLVDPLGTSFDAGGAIVEDFSSPVPAAFAFASYLADSATSRVAGPVFDTPGYAFSVANVPRHHRMQIELDLVVYGPVDTDSSAQSVDVRIDGAGPIRAVLEGDQPTVDGSLATLGAAGSGTTRSGTPFRRYTLRSTSDHLGSAVKVTLTPHNFRGVLGTSLGVDTVRLQLATTPADKFDVALPFTVVDGGGTLGAGAGSLESVAAEDDYAFSVPQDGTRLLLDVVGCLTPQVVLQSVTTGKQVSPDRSGCGDRVFAEVAAGDYVLKLWNAGAPATYGLTLGVAPSAQVFEYAVGQRVSDGHVGDGAAPGAGAIETAGSKDVYTFALVRPSKVLFWGSGGACSSSQLIHVDSGTKHGSVCGRRQYTLPVGRYRIDVPAATSNPTGAYWFESFEVPDGPLPDVPISTDGEPTTTTFGEGQKRGFTFTAAVGQRYRIWLPASTIGYYDQVVRIFAPDGTKVSDTNGGQGSRWYLDAAQSGTYRVEVDPDGDHTGTVTVRVKDISDLQVTSPVDGSDNVLVLDPGQKAQLRFTAAVGQRYRIWLPASTIGYYDQVVRIFAPDGTKVVDSNAGAGTQFVVDAKAGEYRVEVDPDGESSGTVTVRVQPA